MEGLAKTYNAFATWYMNENQIDTSLSLSLKALKYGDILNDSTIKSIAFLNLGIIYYDLNNLTTSKEYCNKAVLFGDKFIQASATANLGMLYNGTEQNDSAFYFFKKANEIFLTLNDTDVNVLSNTAITYMNMGTIAIERNEFSEAKKYFNKSLSLSYKINNFNNIILIPVFHQTFNFIITYRV